jgi:glycosyltransferase involved in cell wall biosynthesis
MKHFSLSVVISFYNKIDNLRLVLAALERQSFKDFEVIIADDGSGTAVVEEIGRIVVSSPLSLQHIWHEDRGFRKTRILNTAIRKSRSEYLVFIDGDCIPHSRFAEEHYRNREPHVLLAGRRAYLSERLSQSLTVGKIQSGYLEKRFMFDLMADGIFGKSRQAFKGLYIRNGLLRRFLNRSMKGVLGSNFSLYKQDIEAVNGFDERYAAPAVGEDSDIELRLGWNRVKFRMVKNIAVQYHIFHKKLERPGMNLEVFESVKRSGQYFTPYGLQQSGDPNYVDQH